MTNEGIGTLCHFLAEHVATSMKLRVVKLGPPTDEGGDLSDQIVLEGLVPLLLQPLRLEV